jgi:hypothetical protein
MPLGVLQFIPIYHTLHDVFGIHTEVPVLIILTIYFLIVWTGDRHSNKDGRSKSIGMGNFELFNFYNAIGQLKSTSC